jgi:hypothetical protein
LWKATRLLVEKIRKVVHIRESDETGTNREKNTQVYKKQRQTVGLWVIRRKE